MQRKEPAACLVNALRDEVRRARSVLILKRIVILRIGHCPRVEPHIYQVQLSLHRLARRRAQHDVIHIRPMQVYHRGVVVLFRVVPHLELRPRVLRHEARLDGLLYLRHQFSDRADTNLLLSVFSTPNRQRRAPVARAREVPVVQVL